MEAAVWCGAGTNGFGLGYTPSQCFGKPRLLKQTTTRCGRPSVDAQEPIKLLLSSGETEIVATKVSVQELPYEAAGAVYFSRWGVEVHFDVLKNRFEIANFAGILAAAIYPEHQATVLLGNLCALAETEVQALWDAQQAEHPDDYKYARYKINTSVAVGQWKDAWVTILLAEDADVRNRAFWDFIHEIRKHVTPIRPNRQFPRRSAPRANRYSHKRRRSL